MGSTSLDSRVLSSAELRVSGESMEKGVITADPWTLGLSTLGAIHNQRYGAELRQNLR